MVAIRGGVIVASLHASDVELMRWPIRNQILLPFVAIQVATIVGISAASSWLAVRAAERDFHARLSGVVQSLKESSFPLTDIVLQQLRQLSGADFVVLDDQQQLRLTTLGDLGDATRDLNQSMTELAGAEITERNRILLIRGESFYAGRISRMKAGDQGAVYVLYRQSDWHAARDRAMWPPLLIGGLCLLLTMAASVLVSQRLGRRIHAVQQHVTRVAAQNFAPMATSPIDDELRDLAQDVNRMAALLDETLQHAAEAERSRVLTQLVGGLSHQLRNALAGARMSVQLHQRRCGQASDVALETALQQLRLTEEQIKALLRVTRGEATAVHAGRLGDVLDEVVTLVTPVCEHQKISLDYRADAGLREVPDADGIRAALLNLLMNAVEAAGPGGSVEVGTAWDEGQFMIDVTDNGPGLSHPEQVFEPFYTTKPEGIGLGLFLARQVVEECHGTLQAIRQNGQTRFRLSLPDVPLVTQTEASSPA